METPNVKKKSRSNQKRAKPSSDNKRKAAADRKRKERDRIREDPVKYELMKEKEKERSRERRALKKIKGINDLSERGKNKQRREWRIRYHKHALKKRQNRDLVNMLDENSPPNSPIAVHNNPQAPAVDNLRSVEEIRKKRKKTLRKSREKYRIKIKKLEKKLKDQSKIADKWKKKHARLKKNESCTKKTSNASPKEGSKNNKKTENKAFARLDLRKEVQKFLIDDDNSFFTPGRKDTITRKKVKKQIRYLSDTLQVLHNKFVSTKGIQLSYPHFCRFKPFWVIQRPANKRDTCMCRYHENFFFLFHKCKQYKILQHKNMNDIVSSLCCDLNNKACVYRECDHCKSKTVVFNESSDVEQGSMIHHFEWKTITEERVKNGKKKLVKVTRKIKIVCTVGQLKEKLCSQINRFMTHRFRVYNQNKFSKYCRSNLNDDEVFLVVDFSENYQLKYCSEIQSRHFGASNEQVTLHTGAYFIKTILNDKPVIKVRTFCTVSSGNRHDAAAIWANLLPIFTEIKENHDHITRVHIMSDGPTKQYRNKSNMYLFCYYMEYFGFQIASYNFSEAGHGKSVADGVSGTIKRTADSAVLMGKDVSNIDQFMNAVSNLKVLVLEVDEANMKNVDTILKAKLRPIKDTLKLHQITWNSQDGTRLNCRFLSCIVCRNKSKCTHQMTSYHNLLDIETDTAVPSTSISGIGNTQAIQDRLRYHEVYSDDGEDEIMVVNALDGTPNQSLSDEVINELSAGDFILVRFSSNKNIVSFYVGQVIDLYGDGDYEVKFLRKTAGGKFVFPHAEDIASVNRKDIIQVLTNLEVHRGIYSFLDLTITPNIN